MSIRFVPLAALAALVPVHAAAQVMTVPERAAEVVSRTTDQSRNTQALSFSLSVLGGQDRNDTESFVSGEPEAVPVFTDTTSTVMVDAGLAYSRASGTHTLGITFNGGSSFYGGGTVNGVPDVGPTKTFNGDITWSAPLGNTTRFNASQRFMYDSLYSLGAFDSINLETPLDEVPGTASQGVAELDSISSDTSIGIQRRLGRRNSLNGSYGYTRQVFLDSIATGETSSQHANVAFARQLRRTTGLTMSYGYSSGEYSPLLGTGGTRPLVGHVIQGGLNFTRRLSPRRAMQFSFDGGATRTDAVTGRAEQGYTFWAPSGSASVRVDVARSWAVTANYSRGTTALSGLTREAYSSDAFGLSLGGSISRASLVAAIGLARGSTDVAAASSSEYSSYRGSLQFSVPIGSKLSGVVQYNWYNYDVSGEAEIPTALPPQYSRSTLRAGLSLRLPLLESR